MNEVDLRLMRAAVTVAEELNFGRAAIRLHISQPGLTKQIQDLEGFLKAQLFERDHKVVTVTDAGRGFVAEARLVLLHHQRAIQAATSIAKGAEAVLSLGQSPLVDPLLTSVVSAVHLPLFPDLHVNVHSDYSPELQRRVASGELDLALACAGMDLPETRSIELENSPLYVLLAESCPLARRRALTINDLRDIPWVLFTRQVSPLLYEAIEQRTTNLSVQPIERHHVTSPEQAAQLVIRSGGVAFLSKAGAWKVALDGLSMRPLEEPDIRVRTVLTARNDAKRMVSEFLRAAVKMLRKVSTPRQASLPLGIEGTARVAI